MDCSRPTSRESDQRVRGSSTLAWALVIFVTVSSADVTPPPGRCLNRVEAGPDRENSPTETTGEPSDPIPEGVESTGEVDWAEEAKRGRLAHEIPEPHDPRNRPDIRPLRDRVRSLATHRPWGRFLRTLLQSHVI